MSAFRADIVRFYFSFVDLMNRLVDLKFKLRYFEVLRWRLFRAGCDWKLLQTRKKPLVFLRRTLCRGITADPSDMFIEKVHSAK